MEKYSECTTVDCDEDELHSFENDNPVYDVEIEVDEVARCARNVFGISSLFPWQRLAIANILDAVHAEENKKPLELKHIQHEKNAQAGSLLQERGILQGQAKAEPEKSSADQSAAVNERSEYAKQIILLPTGAGKSLCFQVPALLLEKPTLVVYPLLALMSDQLRRLKEVGIEPVVLRGGQTAEERREALQRIEQYDDAEKGVKIIIANPEILQSETILTRLEKIGIAHFVIDEAHCVSEWGESFRPSYLHLKSVIERIRPTAISAFTATASPEVLERISAILFDGHAHIVRGETDRQNIYYQVRQCLVKPPALLEIISQVQKPLVIFAGTREGTERIASFLKYGLPHDEIRFYHAGLSRAEKESCEAWFNKADNGILIATCAWGMGVDKKNIRTVIHYEAPATVEAYVQEAGRGGRDGLPSLAVLLWSPSDFERLSRLKGIAGKRAQQLIAFATAHRCRRRVLLHSLGDVNAASRYAEMREVHCAGCDVCDKSADYAPVDGKRLIRFISRFSKVYTQSELVEYALQHTKFWRAADLNALIRMLLEKGTLKRSKLPLWREKLSAGVCKNHIGTAHKAQDCVSGINCETFEKNF